MKVSYSRTAAGQLELRLHDDALLPLVKEVLLRDWGATEAERLETVDQIWVDLRIGDVTLTFHWDEMGGACLIAEHDLGEPLLREIGDHLSRL